MSIKLTEVIDGLNEIAPLTLAGSWDNVGVLIEPKTERGHVTNGLVTIDLTEIVLEEAIELKAELIVAYHPIMFGGVKALRQTNAHGRMIMRAIAHGVTVYSPHTALDAVRGGVNDWLVKGLGEVVDVTALEPAAELVAPTGMGRRAKLAEPVPLEACVTRLKAHLDLSHVRLAQGGQQTIESVAVCPGAGGSMLAPLRGVDLVITGEMRHHDVLALTAAGTSVILTDHTNCERGYLPVLLSKLTQRFGDEIKWHIAQHDADPLVIV